MFVYNKFGLVGEAAIFFPEFCGSICEACSNVWDWYIAARLSNTSFQSFEKIGSPSDTLSTFPAFPGNQKFDLLQPTVYQ